MNKISFENLIVNLPLALKMSKTKFFLIANCKIQAFVKEREKILLLGFT